MSPDEDNQAIKKKKNQLWYLLKRLDKLTEMQKIIVYTRTQTHTPGRKFFSKNSPLLFIYSFFFSLSFLLR